MMHNILKMGKMAHIYAKSNRYVSNCTFVCNIVSTLEVNLEKKMLK